MNRDLFLCKLCLLRLIRNKKRTVLTILGLILSVVVMDVVFLLGDSFLLQQLKGYAMYEEKNILLLQGDLNWSLLDKMTQKLQQNISFEIYQVESGCIGGTDIVVNEIVLNDGNRFQNLPQDLESKTRYESEVLYGTNFMYAKIDEKSIIIDEYLSQRLFGTKNSIGRELYIAGVEGLDADNVTINKYDGYTIIGVIKGSEQNWENSIGTKKEDVTITYNVYLPMKQNVHRIQNHDFQIVIQHSEKKYQKMTDLIVSLLYEENLQDKYDIWNYDSLIFPIEDNIRLYSGIMLRIYAILVIVNCLYIMTIILFSIKERIYEIGVRKSIGASNIDIVEQFVIEGTFYGIVAGVVGGIVAALFTMILHKMGICVVYHKIDIYIQALLIAVLTGIVSSITPAYYASQIKIVDAMRFD